MCIVTPWYHNPSNSKTSKFLLTWIARLFADVPRSNSAFQNNAEYILYTFPLAENAPSCTSIS